MLRRLLTLVVACTSLACAGCTATGSTLSSENAVGESSQVAESTPITPVRQDLSSVVVIPGTVTATPSYLVVAPRSGPVYLGSAGAQHGGDRIGTVGGDPLTLPYDGRISDALVEPGQVVAAGVPVARVRYAGFGVPLTIPAEQLFRMYSEPRSARASVTAGPDGVACALAPTDTEQATEAPEIPGGPAVCLLPLDAAVVAALPARIGLTTGTVTNALTLPIGAVAGSAQAGRVTVVEGDTARVIEVGLGMTDGVSIEITDGLTEASSVLPYAPGLE